ncbi:glycosyltransferase family 4 protein [Limnochorda pilosa]|uniref:Glycosyl transferase family 1 n=1 Tax=Limnochorda pilosa TaxID=1555112 RepID=A0A0K2SPD4_LIMPI|nr:glycosyltransferase family 4 protein [Limnochorda pilosa]BAS28862.1 glycosyl transferase family 1 [Limnochorda pilosa]
MARAVCFVSTYPPRQCGIATFTRDLIQGLQRATPAGTVRARVLAMGDGARYPYPSEVAREIPEADPAAYPEAARVINASCDVVSLQHEYGIFGGEHGAHVLHLIRALERPLITTLHTVLPDPNRQELRILQELARRSERVVVMSRAALPILAQRYRVPVSKIRLIRHGAPSLPFDPTAKARLGLEGRMVVSTFGLIGPGKGLEYAIEAVGRLRIVHPEVLYLVLGRTHPRLLTGEGSGYRRRLEERVRDLHLEDHVRFVDRFLSRGEIALYLSATDAYLTPYPGRNQISSGTLTYALAAGRAIVSTPYLYAQDVLGDGRGLLVPFSDADALAGGLQRLLEEPGLLQTLQHRARAFGKQLSWPAVAMQYLDVFREVAAEPEGRETVPAPGAGPVRAPVPAGRVARPVPLPAAPATMGTERGEAGGRRAGRPSGLAAP